MGVTGSHDAELAPVSGQSHALMVAAVFADTSGHVRGLGAVFNVGAASCLQRGVKCCLVGLGQPHLVRRSEAKVTEHRRPLSGPRSLVQMDPVVVATAVLDPYDAGKTVEAKSSASRACESRVR